MEATMKGRHDLKEAGATARYQTAIKVSFSESTLGFGLYFEGQKQQVRDETDVLLRVCLGAIGVAVAARSLNGRCPAMLR